MQRRRVIGICLAGLLAAAGMAGTVGTAGTAGAQPLGVLQSPVVTVDQERLFRQSAYGKAKLAQLEAETKALAAENRQIESGLVKEELALTKERPTMEKSAFKAKATAFDTKVVAIRKAQDGKARALTGRREELRKAFFKEVLPILTDIVRERGAVVVLQNRAVVLSADQIDITDEAIAKIDARLLPTAPDAPDAPNSDPAGTGAQPPANPN